MQPTGLGGCPGSRQLGCKGTVELLTETNGQWGGECSKVILNNM